MTFTPYALHLMRCLNLAQLSGFHAYAAALRVILEGEMKLYP